MPARVKTYRRVMTVTRQRPLHLSPLFASEEWGEGEESIERENLLPKSKRTTMVGCQMNSDRPIAVAGAGSIGCFVGGIFAAAARRTALLARPRVIREIEDHGLRLTSFEGLDQTLASNRLKLSGDESMLNDASALLVTVKSADTAEISDIIANHALTDAVAVTLQNGADNVSILRY